MRITIKPDIAKAKSLKETSIITLERLEKTDMEKYPSNTLKDFNIQPNYIKLNLKKIKSIIKSLLDLIEK
ncbi:MAG: hypothetical protein V1914_01650 [archaeon]